MFKDHKCIDLTLTLSEDLPSYWPSHMPFQRKNWNWYERVETINGAERKNDEGPYYTEWLIIDEHTGTHFDAPSHHIPHPESGYKNASNVGLDTGEKVNLNKLMGEAVIIDVTNLKDTGNPGESPYIYPEHIEQWEEQHSFKISNQIVLFRSAWDLHYVKGTKGKAHSYNPLITKTGPGWPAPHATAIDWLHERGVYCIGTDGVSIGSSHDGVPAHVAGLSKGMVYVENLTQLDKLPSIGSYFMFLPIKVEGSSGGPGRAIAFIHE